jgi:hypothetical protein
MNCEPEQVLTFQQQLKPNDFYLELIKDLYKLKILLLLSDS